MKAILLVMMLAANVSVHDERVDLPVQVQFQAPNKHWGSKIDHANCVLTKGNWINGHVDSICIRVVT